MTDCDRTIYGNPLLCIGCGRGCSIKASSLRCFKVYQRFERGETAAFARGGVHAVLFSEPHRLCCRVLGGKG